jgi:transcriptional regulator with XRE-family HTH domain
MGWTQKEPSPYDDLYANIGLRVYTERDAVGFTQQVLADKIGVTRVSVANIEAGRQRVTLHTLADIANALGVPLAALIPTSGGTTSEALTRANQTIAILKAKLERIQAVFNGDV